MQQSISSSCLSVRSSQHAQHAHASGARARVCVHASNGSLARGLRVLLKVAQCSVSARVWVMP